MDVHPPKNGINIGIDSYPNHHKTAIANQSLSTFLCSIND
jgi:hypothetical protein